MTFDCTERTTLAKGLAPERPDCLHGPMRSRGRDWMCVEKSRNQYRAYKAQNLEKERERQLRYAKSPEGLAAGRRNDAKRAKNPKRRAYMRDQSMRSTMKNREARIGAMEAVFNTPATLLAHLGVVMVPKPNAEHHEANAMGSRITGAHFLA